MTPGSIVRVLFRGTVRSPVTTYGLADFFHVPLTEPARNHGARDAHALEGDQHPHAVVGRRANVEPALVDRLAHRAEGDLHRDGFARRQKPILDRRQQGERLGAVGEAHALDRDVLLAGIGESANG